MKLKKGDTVVVIAGKDKGKEGEVVRRSCPQDNKVIVNGVNTAKKHQKARKRRTSRAASSTATCRSTSSNVMLVHKGKPTRVGYGSTPTAPRSAIAKRTGEVIA